jgi:hypothetical protein
MTDAVSASLLFRISRVACALLSCVKPSSALNSSNAAIRPLRRTRRGPTVT